MKKTTRSKKIFEKNLGEKLIKQSSVHDPNNKYACFMACCAMIFSTMKGAIFFNLDDYATKCIANGAMRKDFFILNYDLMAKAAGFADLHCKTEIISENGAAKIQSLIDQNRPVIVSLAGEHFECIDGYKKTVNFYFTIDDPGYQNDTRMDGKSLEAYRLVARARVYSVNHAGRHRAATKIYWFV